MLKEKKGKEISLPLHPAPQIIGTRHPVTHQTTEKNTGVEEVSPLTVTCSKARVTRQFCF